MNLIESWQNSRFLNIILPAHCSIQCLYCVSNMHKIGGVRKESVVWDMGPDNYMVALDRLTAPYDNLMIGIMGGGEPSESPMFLRVANWAASKGYTVRIQTNLHGIANLRRFKEANPNAKVIIGLSYHLGTYLDYDRPDLRANFWNWIYEVSSWGWTQGNIVVPLTPAAAYDSNIFVDLDVAKDLGWKPHPVELVNNYKGKFYPRDYTKAETAQVAHVILSYDKTRMQKAEDVRKFTHAIPLKNELCGIYIHRAEIYHDGTIIHCKGTEFANIKDFRQWDSPPVLFHDRPQPCPNEVCKCKNIGAKYCLALQGKTLHDFFRGD